MRTEYESELDFTGKTRGKHIVNALFSALITQGRNAADRNARRVVYAMITDHLVRSDRYWRNEVEAALLILLDEREIRPQARAAATCWPLDEDKVTANIELMKSQLLGITVIYRQNPVYTVDCNLFMTTGPDKPVRRVQCFRDLTWDDMPSVVREQFIRSADDEEVELDLYKWSAHTEADHGSI